MLYKYIINKKRHYNRTIASRKRTQLYIICEAKLLREMRKPTIN